MIKREPVVVVGSVLAALHIFFGGLAAVNLLTGNVTVALIGALGNLATAAAQGGLNFYVRGQVTPVEYAHDDGEDVRLVDLEGPPVPRG